jgi:hypothetical protein
METTSDMAVPRQTSNVQVFQNDYRLGLGQIRGDLVKGIPPLIADSAMMPSNCHASLCSVS